MPKRATRVRHTAPAKGKRYPLNMRTTFEIRQQLESAAVASGRSLAQEVEFRIEQSFLETQRAKPEQPKDAPRTYRVEDAARMLGISRNAAYEAAKNGHIPIVKIGRLLLVPKIAFDRMFE